MISLRGKHRQERSAATIVATVLVLSATATSLAVVVIDRTLGPELRAGRLPIGWRSVVGDGFAVGLPPRFIPVTDDDAIADAFDRGYALPSLVATIEDPGEPAGQIVIALFEVLPWNAVEASSGDAIGRTLRIAVGTTATQMDLDGRPAWSFAPTTIDGRTSVVWSVGLGETTWVAWVDAPVGRLQEADEIARGVVRSLRFEEQA